MKLDTVNNSSISERISQLLLIRSQTPAEIVVFSDFRHGCSIATRSDAGEGNSTGVFSVADSQVASRWGNILEFHGCDLITPNEREARFALGDQEPVVRPLGLGALSPGKMQNPDPQARRTRPHDLPREPENEDVRALLHSTASPSTWSMRSAPATRCSPMRRCRMCRPGSRSLRPSSARSPPPSMRARGQHPGPPNDVVGKLEGFEAGQLSYAMTACGSLSSGYGIQGESGCESPGTTRRHRRSRLRPMPIARRSPRSRSTL